MSSSPGRMRQAGRWAAEPAEERDRGGRVSDPLHPHHTEKQWAGGGEGAEGTRPSGKGAHRRPPATRLKMNPPSQGMLLFHQWPQVATWGVVPAHGMPLKGTGPQGHGGNPGLTNVADEVVGAVGLPSDDAQGLGHHEAVLWRGGGLSTGPRWEQTVPPPTAIGGPTAC